MNKWIRQFSVDLFILVRWQCGQGRTRIKFNRYHIEKWFVDCNIVAPRTHCVYYNEQLCEQIKIQYNLMMTNWVRHCLCVRAQVHAFKWSHACVRTYAVCALCTPSFSFVVRAHSAVGKCSLIVLSNCIHFIGDFLKVSTMAFNL